MRREQAQSWTSRLRFAGRWAARVRLSVPFYLGLRAPAVRRRFADSRVRAAVGWPPELIRTLLALYRGEEAAGAGTVEPINFRCAAITLAKTRERFFFKQFPRRHALHDLERALRCSRADRAWRAAHLLPELGILTPRAVGTATARANDGSVVEYLATEWLEGAATLPERLRRAGDNLSARMVLLREFAQHLSYWHERGVYLRDLVKNVLVREKRGARSYWLTDLDGLHPYRRLTRSRVLHTMRQLSHWAGPISPQEAAAICEEYLGPANRPPAQTIIAALTQL